MWYNMNKTLQDVVLLETNPVIMLSCTSGCIPPWHHWLFSYNKVYPVVFYYLLLLQTWCRIFSHNWKEMVKCIFFKSFKFHLTRRVTRSDESAIRVLPHAQTHQCSWLANVAITDRRESMPPIPSWQHGQLCFLWLLVTDICGIIGTQTRNWQGLRC